ncbi:MAG: type II toxin-antitoxin system VapC family toxin [Actinomycetes bacterium]
MMRLLLDTHVLLWWLDGQPLSDAASTAIADPANEVFISSASMWEISIKSEQGKLRISDGFMQILNENAFLMLPISWGHALNAGGLPLHHRDPFDRMLVAQAQGESLTLVTRDEKVLKYDIDGLVA